MRKKGEEGGEDEGWEERGGEEEEGRRGEEKNGRGTIGERMLEAKMESTITYLDTDL